MVVEHGLSASPLAVVSHQFIVYSLLKTANIDKSSPGKFPPSLWQRFSGILQDEPPDAHHVRAHVRVPVKYRPVRESAAIHSCFCFAVQRRYLRDAELPFVIREVLACSRCHFKSTC